MSASEGDRVKETWTGSGTTAVTLAGPVPRYQSFANGIGVGNTCFYLIDDPANSAFEIGRGTVSNATTLTRDTPLLTLSGGITGTSFLNFAAGSTKTVLAFYSSAPLPNSIVAEPNLTASIGICDSPFTAGTNPAAFQSVYIDKRDGKVYLAEADVVGTGSISWNVGFTTEAGTVGNPVNTRTAGIVPGFGGLTVGTAEWLDNTAGSVTGSTPLNEVYLGLAISTTQILSNDLGDRSRSTFFLGEKAFFAGGQTGLGGTPVFTIQKFTFLEVSSVIPAVLAKNVGQPGYNSEGSYKGFWLGGATAAGAQITTAQKILYSTETLSLSAGANLTIAKENPSSLSERRAKGYTVAGSNLAASTLTCDKTLYASEVTAANTPGNIGTSTSQVTAVNEGNTKGYFLGGQTGANVNVTTGNILYYAQDVTAARTTTNLSQARNSAGGMSDGISKGYAGGGSTVSSGAVATTDKITYATDTTAALASANLSLGRAYAYSASQGQSYGFVYGGWTGNKVAVNNIDKLTFATDTDASSTATTASTVDGMSPLSDVGL